MTSKILKTILSLMRKDFKILPLKPKGKTPIYKGGVHNATADIKEIKRVFRQRPDANYGIATGKASDLLVLDIDGAKGKKSLHKLVAEHGKLPRTVKVKTGKGLHYYFRPGTKRVRNSASTLSPGIDIRGDGGYVVGPGSIHESGATYRFVAGRSVGTFKIAKAPRWLLKLAASAHNHRDAVASSIPKTKIDRAQAYMTAALHNELGRLTKAPKHQRNDTLNRCAFKLGQLMPYGLLEHSHVVRELSSVATSIGLMPEEIGPTIKSGLEAGVKHPRSLPFLRSTGENEQPTASTVGDLTEKLSSLGETDTDNAQRLAARYADKIIYTNGRGWLVYKQGRWLPGAQTECIELAKDTARLIADEAQYLQSDEAKAGRARFAKASLSKGALDRMVELTKGLVTVEDGHLDADPWLLNTANGTIDLRTGYIERHDPSDLLTQIAPVVADRKDKCPLFKAFLKRITGNDKKLMRYIQKCIGYSLTGDTREQVFFFCHGSSGKNGKSTLVNLIRDMLGDYGRHTPTETLLVKQYDNGIPNDQARLAGVRMVTAIEANYNRQLDEAKLKAMTGGENIAARFMRQDYFEFKPVFKLWLVANDRPRIRGTDTAMWRRVRVIPFDVEIPDAEIDKDLSAKLQVELPGILAWAVRGCLAWQKDGLVSPPAVERAGGDWAAAADHLKRFVSDTLIEDAGHTVAASSMYHQYEEWCGRNGEKPLGIKPFTQALKTNHNFTHKRAKSGSVWADVKYRRT